jgi:hypothetical protein
MSLRQMRRERQMQRIGEERERAARGQRRKRTMM